MARDGEAAPAVEPARGLQRTIIKIPKRVGDLPGSFVDRGTQCPTG
jgi:hypothetical protein